MDKRRKVLVPSLVLAGVAIVVVVLALFGVFVFHSVDSCHEMGGTFRFDWFDCELSGDPFDFVKIVLKPKAYITGSLIALAVGVVVFFISKRILMKRLMNQEVRP
jgi:hypothetical protein